MGRVLLVCRLAVRDLRRRPGEAALLLLAIMAATTMLTLGLVLRGVTSKPYQSTREATAGPDVVAGVVPLPEGGRPADLAGLTALIDAPGVVDHSGPYPVTVAELDAHGRTVAAHAVGRDTATAPIDQPKLTEGTWVSDGGVVVEAAFADVLDVVAGESVTLNGRSFGVVGLAVTAAAAPYEGPSCYVGLCVPDAGVVWLTEADARSLAPQEALAYVLNLRLADPAAAPAFVNAHASYPPAPGATSWQDILDQADNLVRNQRRALLTGAWLLGVLAVASVTVLVGGRMADQINRVGLLKAVGGTPGLVAAVLLAEYVVVSLLAAAAGLAAGWLTSPLLTEPSAGLVGRAGAPPLTTATIGVVTAVALGVAVAATLVPAVRAARTSTVRALADSARPPRRTAWLIAISARMPAPLLVGLRIAARQATPRRAGRGQHRRHDQRHRRRAGSPRRPQRPANQRVLRVGQFTDRPNEPGAAGAHHHARRPRRRQRNRHHLGDSTRCPPLLGADAGPRRDT